MSPPVLDVEAPASADNHLGHNINILRPKKIIICFSGTARVTFNPPASKIFIVYSVFALKNRLYIVSLGWLSFSTILFVDWLVRILKVENFSGNYSDTSFYSISFKKIKAARPHHFQKKCLNNILLIFFLPKLFIPLTVYIECTSLFRDK